jgi:CRISPR-associated protein Csx17
MLDERMVTKLEGCSPQPLGSYLKALGIFRIVAEQADTNAVGYWADNGVFVIQSSLNDVGLMRFLVERYRPTPIMAPWNGGSGFYPKDNKTAINWVRESRTDRLTPYREALQRADAIMAYWENKPSKDEKEELLQACRANLPERTVDWLDAAFVLGTETPKYPPLLGTGGNDGRLEFTNNFMQRLMNVIDLDGRPTPRSSLLLRSSLFGDLQPGLLRGESIGQFNPSKAGGANTASGFGGDSLVNPWDFILMIEGSLFFAGGVVKRGETNLGGELSFPFSVRPSGVGYGTASKGDETSARAEIWVPLWSIPTSYGELRFLFSEGRSNVERRKAKDGTDFARAVATLGVDRGIDSFQRFGFMERNGRAFFAVPLGRIPVRRNPQADLLASIDGWLLSFRSRALGDNVPASVLRALAGLDRSIFQLCTEENPHSVQAMLISLGECERALCVSSKWSEEQHLAPVPALESEWFVKGYDCSSEYRIAAAIALISGSFALNDTSISMPIRTMVEPINMVRHPHGTRVKWAENRRALKIEGRPIRVLNEIMSLRIKEHLRIGVEGGYADRSPIQANLEDIVAFLGGRLDEERIIRLFWGLVLLDPFGRYMCSDSRAPDSEYPGSAYSLLKLCYTAGLKDIIRDAKDKEFNVPLPLTPEIHRRAVAGDIRAATGLAARRLRGSRLEPKVGESVLSAAYGMQIAASLLIPLDNASIIKIAERTLMEESI